MSHVATKLQHTVVSLRDVPEGVQKKANAMCSKECIFIATKNQDFQCSHSPEIRFKKKILGKETSPHCHLGSVGPRTKESIGSNERGSRHSLSKQEKR